MGREQQAQLRNVRTFLQEEKWLMSTGLLGFLLAAVCGIWTLINGGAVAPEGDVSKAVSFNAAVGIFLMTTAAILPLAAMGKRSSAIFRWAYIVLALYAYGVETAQQFRGVNPRFSKSGEAIDDLLGSLFGVVAMLMIVFYVFLAIQYFRKKTKYNRPEIILGIRYAMISVIISFAAGIWIAMLQSRYTGASGNIIWLHGIGFHALQAIPLAAWLTERASLSRKHRRKYVHLVGILYLLGLSAIGWQTLLGQPILEWSLLPVAASACFLFGIGVSIRVLSMILMANTPTIKISRSDR